MALVALIAAASSGLPAPSPVNAQPQVLTEWAHISVTPDCAAMPSDPAGQTITVTVRGFSFTPGTVVALRWQGQPLGPPGDQVAVGDFGTFEATVGVPLGGATFSYVVDAFYAPIGDQRTPVASAQFSAPCQPAIRITQDCGAAGAPVTVHVDGSRFLDGLQVVARITDGAADYATFGPATQDPNAVSFDMAFTPPHAGRYDVVVTQVAPPGEEFYPPSAYASFVVPCPSLTVTPTCADAGGADARYAIQLSGSGFLPYYGVEFFFDPAGVNQRFYWDFSVPETGTWGPVEIQPYRRGPFVYEILVRQRGENGVIHDTRAYFTVPCAVPDVSIDPVCAPPQISGDAPRTFDLRVTGQNLSAGELTLVFDAEGRSGPPQQVAIPVSGAIDVSVPILRRPTGTYVVTVTQAGTALAETFLFEVPCEVPRARVRMRCEPENTNLPELADVVISVRGFYADSPLQLSIAGEVQTVRTDAAGFHGLSLPAGDRPPGTLEVIATQSDAAGIVAQASAVLLLPCGSREPVLVISPPVASPGGVVAVEGFNFRPGASISLRWDRGIGSAQTIDIVADADGAFSQQVLIFPHDFLGTRQLNVESSTDQFASGLAADFLVLAGRGSPPAFVVDNQAPDLPGPIIIRR